MSSPLTLRLAHTHEADRIIVFINENFDWKLPLVNLPEFFSFYYQSGSQLQYAVAEENNELLAVVGYIRASNADNADIWASVWVAKKGCNGVGLELMDALPRLTGASVVACNNIRPKTMAFYRFLGWHADRMPHYYRLSGQAEYTLARISDATVLPVEGDLSLTPITNQEQMQKLGLPPTHHTPKKDLWYLTRRYFAFPHLEYQVYAAQQQGQLLAYLVARVVDSGCGKVLRIVDFIGEDAVLPRLGRAIDELLHQVQAEYAECYCAGISAQTFAQAGFCERTETSSNILPNYLTPPLFENTEYYYFTNKPDGFVMFKADGDQDRPNLSVD